MFKILLLLLLFPLIAYPHAYSQEMTLEEKVGQILIVHFNGEVANEDARILIQDLNVGGFIYYNWSNTLSSPEQVKQLSQSLQDLAKTPLLLSIDQEGGVVTRLRQGFTVFPGNRALGLTNDPNLAKESAYIMGKELVAVGINLNYAPVVDINTNPKNPIIGTRSFGETPEIVIAFAEKALQGFKQANVLTTIKHYPGHGDVDKDSHLDLPVVNKSMEELEKMELLPFSKLASQTDLVMTAHILVPAFDLDHCSTLSEKTLSYLRHQIGFQGVIVSDSLVMEGVLKSCKTVDEAAVQAFNAGCDLLMLGGKAILDSNTKFELNLQDIQRVHQSLVNAVKSGRISESRLNEANERIRKLKASRLPISSI